MHIIIRDESVFMNAEQEQEQDVLWEGDTNSRVAMGKLPEHWGNQWSGMVLLHG